MVHFRMGDLMKELYSDALVSITDDGIVVHHYYLFGGSKRVGWNDVLSVRALLPTLWNGRWRLAGTGTFSTAGGEYSAGQRGVDRAGARVRVSLRRIFAAVPARGRRMARPRAL